MYWFKWRTAVILPFTVGIMLTACLQACKPEIKETGGTLKYFDIKGYFGRESARLNQLKKPVDKTVTHNGSSESKRLYIGNWAHELDLFTGSDINRPAWKNSYIAVESKGLLFYKAKDPELKMREMIIKKDQQEVKWILIYNRSPKNILYQTTEKLSYFPDSLYLIEKTQKVRLMGNNIYRVKGLFSR